MFGNNATIRWYGPKWEVECQGRYGLTIRHEDPNKDKWSYCNDAQYKALPYPNTDEAIAVETPDHCITLN
jgi:hypothetical protein